MGNILDILSGNEKTPEINSNAMSAGGIRDILQNGLKFPDPKPNKRVFTDRLYCVIAYRLDRNGNIIKGETRTFKNKTASSAGRLRKALKKQGFGRIDRIETSSKAHGKELIFTEKNYIEKNVSKFTPGTPTITDNRLKDQRQIAHKKMELKEAKKNHMTEWRSDTFEIQIFSKVDNNLVFKGEETEAVKFLLTKQIKINEHVFYLNGKIWSAMRRIDNLQDW